MSVSPSRNLFLMNSSLIEEAAALVNGGMWQPAGGKAAAAENWINSDSIADIYRRPPTRMTGASRQETDLFFIFLIYRLLSRRCRVNAALKTVTIRTDYASELRFSHYDSR